MYCNRTYVSCKTTLPRDPGRISETYLREYLPYKHDEEDNIEELEARFRLGLISVQRFEERANWNIHGPQHVRWIHEDLSQQSSETVPDQL
jgi:hypothetical protein